MTAFETISRATSIDLAREAEFAERDARREALHQANMIGGHPDEVVERAAAYHAFLTGQ